MDENPNEPPMNADVEATPKRELVPRPLVRIGIGIFAGLFVAPALWVAIVMMTQQHSLAELQVIPSMILGGIAAGWAAFSSITPLRIGAWAAAGLGAGLVLDAILMGGLGVGTFLTPSGLVLGLVFSIIGIRADSSRGGAGQH